MRISKRCQEMARLPCPGRCEVDVFGFFGSGDDGIDVFGVAADELVFHRKAVAGIDRAAFGDEVADVSVGREDFKIAAQIFFQGFGFGRGFDD